MITALKEIEKNRLYEKLDQTTDSDVRKKIMGRLEKVETVESLEQLGYTPQEAFKLLLGMKKTIVLEEKDITPELLGIEKKQDNWFCTSRDETVENLNDVGTYILVHKTNYPPYDGMIHSRDGGHVLSEDKIVLGGEEYTIKYEEGRDTTHFSVNHGVTSHGGGNWDNMKYSVLIPCKDVDRGKVGRASAVDFYVRGNVSISQNSYILCPRGESDEILKNNPNANVVEYEGASVKNFENALVSLLGYKVHRGNEHGWDDGDKNNQYNAFMRQQGYTVGKHFYSEDKQKENTKLNINYVMAVIKLIKDQRFIK